MSPEYGATMGIFPVDQKTLDYMVMTNRADRADRTEAYMKANGMFYSEESEAQYSQVVELDLATVVPSLAGPARPQDRIRLNDMKDAFAEILGCDYDRDAEVANISTVPGRIRLPYQAQTQVHSGLPALLYHRGQRHPNLHRRRQRGGGRHHLLHQHLQSPRAPRRRPVGQKCRRPRPESAAHVKTSLAPGSRVVIDYLQDAGLMPALEALGFHLAAFGCTTCIGNSGPLDAAIEKTIKDNDLNVASVLSGNRNFEARIHQSIKSNFLASPMLVVAYALAGRVDTNLCVEPVGMDTDGEPVYLADIWPTDQEITALVKKHVKQEFYKTQYGRIFDGDEFWHALDIKESTTYAWDPASTYIKKPPYFEASTWRPPPPATSKTPAPFYFWVTRSPPTTSPRPGPSPKTTPPANTSSARASTRPNSTPTAPAAATMKS
jgi:aconitate hydratase